MIMIIIKINTLCFTFVSCYLEDLLPDTQRILNAYTPSVDSGLPSSSPPFFSPGVSANGSSQLSTAVINHQTSLGITLSGGTNKPDGPNIYISDIADGSDAQKVFFSLLMYRCYS